MQVIALVFGSELIKRKEICMIPIKTIKSNPLFSGVFSAYALHGNTIKPSEEFLVLARSSACVQSIKHKTKSFYGVLFHPEVRNQEIIKNFIRITQ